MRSIKRYFKGQTQNAVVARQVISPQETLLPEFNRNREEAKHCNENRQRQQLWNASTERIHPGFLVERHRLLLLFGGLGVLKLLVKLVNFGFEHAHFSHALVALKGQGRKGQLDEGRHEQNDDAVVQAVAVKPIEHGRNDVLADPSKNSPTKGYYLIEFQIEVLERLVVVRTVVPYSLSRNLAVDRGHAEFGLKQAGVQGVAWSPGLHVGLYKA